MSRILPLVTPRTTACSFLRFPCAFTIALVLVFGLLSFYTYPNTAPVSFGNIYVYSSEPHDLHSVCHHLLLYLCILYLLVDQLVHFSQAWNTFCDIFVIVCPILTCIKKKNCIKELNKKKTHSKPQNNKISTLSASWYALMTSFKVISTFFLEKLTVIIVKS